jgi:hypothetical protein
MGHLMEEKQSKYDKVAFGVILGTILPIIGFIISFYVKNRNGVVDFDTYIDMAFKSSAEQQDILIFCLIPNMLMFYLSNFRWKWNEFTKGLVAVTIICLIALILLTY